MSSIVGGRVTAALKSLKLHGFRSWQSSFPSSTCCLGRDRRRVLSGMLETRAGDRSRSNYAPHPIIGEKRPLAGKLLRRHSHGDLCANATRTPQAAGVAPLDLRLCVKGHWNLPSGGRETCPVTVTGTAR